MEQLGDSLGHVVRDVSRTLNYLPQFSGNLAWRLHTDDWMKVRQEMEAWVDKDPSSRVRFPWSQLFICGVQVFADDDAPRLQDSAKGGL